MTPKGRTRKKGMLIYIHRGWIESGMCGPTNCWFDNRIMSYSAARRSGLPPIEPGATVRVRITIEEVQ